MGLTGRSRRGVLRFDSESSACVCGLWRKRGCGTLRGICFIWKTNCHQRDLAGKVPACLVVRRVAAPILENVFSMGVWHLLPSFLFWTFFCFGSGYPFTWAVCRGTHLPALHRDRRCFHTIFKLSSYLRWEVSDRIRKDRIRCGACFLLFFVFFLPLSLVWNERNQNNEPESTPNTTNSGIKEPKSSKKQKWKSTRKRTRWCFNLWDEKLVNNFAWQHRVCLCVVFVHRTLGDPFFPFLGVKFLSHVWEYTRMSRSTGGLLPAVVRCLRWLAVVFSSFTTCSSTSLGEESQHMYALRPGVCCTPRKGVRHVNLSRKRMPTDMFANRLRISCGTRPFERERAWPGRDGWFCLCRRAEKVNYLLQWILCIFVGVSSIPSSVALCVNSYRSIERIFQQWMELHTVCKF